MNRTNQPNVVVFFTEQHRWDTAAVADRMRERLLRRMKEAGEDEPVIKQAVRQKQRGQRVVKPEEVEE